MPKEVIRWACGCCGKEWANKEYAETCEQEHVQFDVNQKEAYVTEEYYVGEAMPHTLVLHIRGREINFIREEF